MKARTACCQIFEEGFTRVYWVYTYLSHSCICISVGLFFTYSNIRIRSISKLWYQWNHLLFVTVHPAWMLTKTYQYIKILSCVCVCVCLFVHDGSGMFVGPIVMRNLRTSIYLLNLKLHEECSRTLGWNPAGVASGCMQSEATVEADAIRRAAVEADAIGEQQPKWTWSGSAAEADAIEEQELEADANRTSSWSRRNRGASGRNRGAAALHRELSSAGLLTVGERGGSSWASEASEATYL